MTPATAKAQPPTAPANAQLPDPQRVLLGAGRQTRFLRLDSPAVLRRPDVAALLSAATARTRTPFRAKGRGKLTIRSISAKQRPRRKSAD
jgi:hypothetical protein